MFAKHALRNMRNVQIAQQNLTMNARYFSIIKKYTKTHECLRWRKDERIDDIIDEFDFTERDQVRQNYPHGYHHTDK